MRLHSRVTPRSVRLSSARSPLLLLSFFLATILTSANGALIHKDEPEVIFSTPRPVVPPTTQGNGIQPSPDGSLIYLTSADGTLTALDARSGQVRFTIQPRPRDDGWTTECNSGIALYHDKEDGNNGSDGSLSDYLVYAIVDIPPTNSPEKVSSRIFAVDVEDTDDGVLRWVTSRIPGRIAELPLLTLAGCTCTMCTMKKWMEVGLLGTSRLSMTLPKGNCSIRHQVQQRMRLPLWILPPVRQEGIMTEEKAIRMICWSGAQNRHHHNQVTPMPSNSQRTFARGRVTHVYLRL